jgi:hypothetical protein
LYLGELPASTSAPHYDSMRAPLERRRMPIDAKDARGLPPAVEAGLHFLRTLELNATTKKYRTAFLTKYTMQRLGQTTDDAIDIVDDASARFVQTMFGRAPDARMLASDFRHPGTPQIEFDPVLQIAAADVL